MQVEDATQSTLTSRKWRKHRRKRRGLLYSSLAFLVIVCGVLYGTHFFCACGLSQPKIYSHLNIAIWPSTW